MISIRADFEDLNDEINELILEGKAAVARTANFVVRSGSQRMRLKIRTGPKTGRVYNGHQASAPGEAPASYSGYLAGSIHHTEMTDKLTSEADITVDADYADTLEFGGFNESGRYVEPRPFIYTSVMEALSAAGPVFDAELRKIR